MDDYQTALARAKTVADCQRVYEEALAAKRRAYQKDYPETYRSLAASKELDYWIKAENRAKVIESGQHSYGNLIRRQIKL